MKGSKKESSNRLGMFFSIALHAGLILLILYWGFSGSTEFTDNNPGPIQVSLSGLDGGSAGSKPPPPVKKSEPVPPEPEPEEVVEEEPPPPEPEPEPEKKEVIKEEPKKDAIPLEEKKEVAKKPEPTPKATSKPKPTEKPKPKATAKPTDKPKPKATAKPTAKPKPKPTKKPKPKKDFDKEKEQILKDIQRQKVLDELKNKPDSEEPIDNFEDENLEEMGQEQRLAMGGDIKTGGEPNSGGSSSSTSSGGSSLSPLIIKTYANQVHRKISRNWRIPPGVPLDQGLATSLAFKVDGSGKVLDVRITSSSGNTVFDNYCRQAILRSSPLPSPPAELAEEAKKSGVEITFRPDQ